LSFGVATSEEPLIAAKPSGGGIKPKEASNYTFKLKKSLVSGSVKSSVA